jgi:hypothetical protein
MAWPLIATAAVSLIGSAMQANAQKNAGATSAESLFGEASLLEEQGSLARDDYFRQAALIRDEGHRTRAKQTMDYISSGVELVGTPLLVLKETLSRSYARASSYETAGVNAQNLYGKKAAILRKEGRASITAGSQQGAGTLLSGAGNVLSMFGGSK